MLNEQHLLLQKLILAPADEWKPNPLGWTVARVAEGHGFCFRGDGDAREINPGDAIVAGPRTATTLRASQLCDLTLDYFQVVPLRLNGLITVLEWRQLEHVSGPGSPPFFYYAASDPLAQKFTRLAALSHADDLSGRTGFLQLWAASVASLLRDNAEPGAKGEKLRKKFRQLVGAISEKELVAFSLAEIAARLNCSERHFNKLFREEFGLSFRKCQAELCLQRAQVLLADDGIKISQVARASGYRKPGFFNTLFKKRFGLSPSEWRRRNWGGSRQDKVTPSPDGSRLARQNSTAKIKHL